MQDIQGALSPTITQPSEAFPLIEKPTAVSRVASRMAGSTRLSSSGRLSTPLGVRARLSSLGNSPRPKKTISSSTLTLQGTRKPLTHMRPTSPSSSEDATDSEDEEVLKEEEADRNLEEQETLDRKLKDLQLMITNDALGLVSAPQRRGKGKEVDRGRAGVSSSISMRRNSRPDELGSRSASQSVSSTSSPHGSIPSIPSPTPESQPHSPISRHLSPSKSSSPAVSPRSALGTRYGPLVGTSEQGSSHGSEASSFSDISGWPYSPPHCVSLTVFSPNLQIQVSQHRRWTVLSFRTYVVLVLDCKLGLLCIYPSDLTLRPQFRLCTKSVCRPRRRDSLLKFDARLLKLDA